MDNFIEIWTNNANMLPIQYYEFDRFINIINKLKKKSILNIQEKKIFIELLELMAETIYTINNYADKYGTTYYQQTKIYDEPELNCCSNLLHKLELEILEELENNYDIEFIQSCTQSKSD